MKVILVLIAVIAGKPHQVPMEVPSTSECLSEAAKFLEYAQGKEEIEKAGAVCQIAKEPTTKS